MGLLTPLLVLSSHCACSAAFVQIQRRTLAAASTSSLPGEPSSSGGAASSRPPPATTIVAYGRRAGPYPAPVAQPQTSDTTSPLATVIAASGAFLPLSSTPAAFP